MSEEIKFIRGKHFSRSGLAQRLNEKFGSKGSGKKFNARDIQQYGIKGKLPEKYGGCLVREIKEEYLGVFIEVDFNDK